MKRDVDDEGWSCPQPGCTRPLSAHIVTLAQRSLALHEGRPWPQPQPVLEAEG